MGGKITVGLAAAALALAALGCGANTEKETSASPRIIPDQEEKTKFDLPPHHFIYRGMETDRLTSLVGEPQRKEKQQNRQEWYYDWGMVLLKNGEVDYKYPPSRAVQERGSGGDAPDQMRKKQQ